jgi:four helix bundle protein
MFAYQKLEVYLKARIVTCKVYQFIKNNRSIPPYIKNQLGRASLSVMLNIAEGSAKFASMDRRSFFVIARASSFECCSLIDFLFQQKELTQDFKNELENSFEEISRILYAMIRNLERKNH